MPSAQLTDVSPLQLVRHTVTQKAALVLCGAAGAWQPQKSRHWNIYLVWCGFASLCFCC